MGGLAGAWPNACRARNTIFFDAEDVAHAIAWMPSHLNEWQHTRFAKAPKRDIGPLPSVLELCVGDQLRDWRLGFV